MDMQQNNAIATHTQRRNNGLGTADGETSTAAHTLQQQIHASPLMPWLIHSNPSSSPSPVRAQQLWMCQLCTCDAFARLYCSCA